MVILYFYADFVGSMLRHCQHCFLERMLICINGMHGQAVVVGFVSNDR